MRVKAWLAKGSGEGARATAALSSLFVRLGAAAHQDFAFWKFLYQSVLKLYRDPGVIIDFLADLRKERPRSWSPWPPTPSGRHRRALFAFCLARRSCASGRLVNFLVRHLVSQLFGKSTFV